VTENELTAFSDATVGFNDGSKVSNVPVKIFPNWVRISEGGAIEYHPREEIEFVVTG